MPAGYISGLPVKDWNNWTHDMFMEKKVKMIYDNDPWLMPYKDAIDASDMKPKPPIWISIKMITCPNRDQYVAVS